MSFGSSVGDIVLIVQLAWNTFDGARRACGEHDELTREVSSLHKVLSRLQKDAAEPKSLVNRASNERREELEEHVAGCKYILKIMNSVLTKNNQFGAGGKRRKRLFQKIKFGNGEMRDLSEIRVKLSAHTSAIMMSLNLCQMDSLGRVEKTLERIEAQSASHGQDLRGLRKSLHWATATMSATSGGDGSVWTSYSRDDQSFWRDLRRELVNEGYNSTALKRHKKSITAYIEELGSRGVFDELGTEESQYIHAPRHGLHRLKQVISISSYRPLNHQSMPARTHIKNTENLLAISEHVKVVEHSINRDTHDPQSVSQDNVKGVYMILPSMLPKVSMAGKLCSNPSTDHS